MANNKLPDVELKMLNGRPTVHIDGKPNPFNTYHNFGLKKIKHTMAWFATVPMDVYYIAPDRLPDDYNYRRATALRTNHVPEGWAAARFGLG